MKTLKVLSALLTYPTDHLVAAAGELKTVLAKEALLKPKQLAALAALIDDIAQRDLFDAQERYIMLFDRTRSLSLHLFEHVHGESRDRGQAMVDLIKVYEDGGYTPTTSELPDFLPLFLEYLSTRPRTEACAMLGQTVHILSALAERLRKRRSPYEAAVRALVALAATKPSNADLAALMAEPDPEPDDLAALDAAWEDQPVDFGPAAGHGCKDDLIARVRAGRRPAPGVAAASNRPVISRP